MKAKGASHRARQREKFTPAVQKCSVDKTECDRCKQTGLSSCVLSADDNMCAPNKWFEQSS